MQLLLLMGEHFLLQGYLENLSPEVIGFLRKDPANWKVLLSASIGLLPNLDDFIKKWEDLHPPRTTSGGGAAV